VRVAFLLVCYTHTHTRPVIVDGAWVTAATLVETSNAAMIFINASLTTLNLIVAVFLNVKRSLRISRERRARHRLTRKRVYFSVILLSSSRV
jgi:hypothetical protein